MRISIAILVTLLALLPPTHGVAQPATRGTVILAICDATTPFESAQARIEFMYALAAHVGQATGMTVTPKVFARVEDFVAAQRRNEVQYALLGAPYLIGSGANHPQLGVAVRGGATSSAWEVVAAKPVASLADLRGQTLVMPRVGARDAAFLTNVLFEGEVDEAYLGRLTYAPDSIAAISTVNLGRATAAVVPAGLPLPAGLVRGLTLRPVSWPVLVALPGTQPATNERVAAAVLSFRSTSAITGFAAVDGKVASLARSMSRPEMRGPMALPPAELDVRGLFGGRTFKIERPELARFAAP